jgi:hypothetical protein
MNNVLISDRRVLEFVLRAAETDPVVVEAMLAASGIDHPIVMAGVDPGRKRMVVITDLADPAAAALMLSDLQVSFKAVQLVVVRITSGSDMATDGLTDISLGLGWVHRELFATVSDPKFASDNDTSALATDGLRQYFFPAPDHLALALIDRWRFATIPQVVDQMVRAPDVGHPFGPPELVGDYESFTDLIQELQQIGLVATIDGHLEITESGRAVRAVVQMQPREALASKLLNRMKASLGFQPIWLPVIRGHADGTGTF